MDMDSALRDDLIAARRAGEAATRENLGPYDALFDSLAQSAGDDFLWVRDITLSNSMAGNRLMNLRGPRDGVHATGGGIGQGLPMAIGAALASPDRQTLCLTGDGGLQLCIGELATLAESGARVMVVVMNDQGYGVIRNIQDAHYGGRRGYTDVLTPKFADVCASLGLSYYRVDDMKASKEVLGAAIEENGPTLVEIDMISIGDFAARFAGPPVRNVEGKDK
jgi:acetolactate synthase-1/2/3 large subunit